MDFDGGLSTDGRRYEGIFGEPAGAPKSAGAYNQLGAAPMPAERRAESFRALASGGALAGGRIAEDKALLKDAPSSATREDDGRRSVAPSLDAAVRVKLTPELIALLERPNAATSELLTVRVRLTEGAESVRAQLEAAGLHITHLKDRMVVGTIEPGRLATLAALDVVQRVAPAEPPFALSGNACDRSSERRRPPAMKIVKNKTQQPVSVPLPRGKTLHLGPGKTGQIASNDADHPRLTKLVEAGAIEILDEDTRSGDVGAGGKKIGGATHGHTPGTGRRGGDR